MEAFGLQRGSAPKNKADTLEGVLDLKQAVERAASLGVALTSEQMAAINAKRDDEDEVASMVMAAFKAFDAAGKRSGTYVVGKDEEAPCKPSASKTTGRSRPNSSPPATALTLQGKLHGNWHRGQGAAPRRSPQ